MAQEIHIHDPFTVPFQTFLSNVQVRELIYNLRRGSLCILPSDTCYALAGLPTLKSVVDKISTILKKDSEEISLSFGSLRMVERWVDIETLQRRLIDEKTPGPVTVICDIRHDMHEERRKALSETLHTDFNIGVRITESSVERQLSTEIESPLTTCAIRDDDDDEVRNYDDAYDIIKTRLEEEEIRATILGVRISQVQYQEHSTVVGFEGNNQVLIYREGILDPEVISKVVSRWGYSDIEDMT